MENKVLTNQVLSCLNELATQPVSIQTLTVVFVVKLLLVLGQSQSSSSEEKQQGLSVDKELLSQLFQHCLANLLRMEPLVYMDPRVNRDWMEEVG